MVPNPSTLTYYAPGACYTPDEVTGMPEYQGDADVDELLSLPDAGALAGLDTSARRRRIHAERLKHRRIGRSYATTLRWIAESEAPGPRGRPPRRLPEHLRPKDGVAGT